MVIDDRLKQTDERGPFVDGTGSIEGAADAESRRPTRSLADGCGWGGGDEENGRSRKGAGSTSPTVTRLQRACVEPRHRVEP